MSRSTIRIPRFRGSSVIRQHVRGNGARQALVALWIGVTIVTLGDATSGQSQTVNVGPGAMAQATPWVPERLPDGQPNVMGGLWRTPNADGRIGGTTYLRDVSGGDSLRHPSWVVDPPNGEVPYQSWAAALWKNQELNAENPTRPEHIDPQARCIETVPRYHYYVASQMILQPPGTVVFLWENYHQYRVIPLDGSPHIAPHMKLWMGDARGHWEGNTLVVDTTNLNGKSRLTESHFFSSNARMRERMTFVDANTMHYEVTIDDPTVYTRPWTMRVVQKRLSKEELFKERGHSDFEFWEEGCVEGLDERPSTLPAFRGIPADATP